MKQKPKNDKLANVIVDYDVIIASPTLYDAHIVVMINRAKFDARMFSSFGEIKAHKLRNS